MKILERYIFKEFFKYFLLITFAFYFIFIVGNFIEKIDLIKNFNMGKIGLYYLLNFPDIFNNLLPYILFFSLLLSFLNFGRNNETIIMQVSGIRPLKFLRYIFIFVFFLSILTFFNYAYISPRYKFQAYRIYITDLRGSVRYFSEMNKRDLGLVFNKGFRYYLFSQYYNSSRKMLTRPNIVVLNKNLDLIKFISGKIALYMGNGTWKFLQYRERNFTKGRVTSLSRKENQILSLNLDPNLFNTQKLKPQNFTLTELRKKILSLKKIGKKTTKFSLEYQLRISFAIFIFLIPFFTIPLGLQFRKGNHSKVIGLGLIIITLYVTIFRFSLTLGTSGIISPFMSAWSINIIIFVLLFIFGKKGKIVL